MQGRDEGAVIQTSGVREDAVGQNYLEWQIIKCYPEKLARRLRVMVPCQDRLHPVRGRERMKCVRIKHYSHPQN